MRTYILALTKYAIAGLMLLYTVMAYVQLRTSGRQRRKQNNIVITALFFVIQSLMFGTVFVGLKEGKYLIFWLFQIIVFTAYLILQKVLYPDGNYTLKVHICLLITTGMVMIERLSFEKSVRQFVIACLGMALSLMIPWLMRKFHYLKKVTYLYAFCGIAALLIVLILGQVTQGSKLSFTIFGITLQPSEFVKIIFVFYLASVYYARTRFKDIFAAAVISGIHVLILVASTDLGSGLIFYVVFVFMTFLASGKWRYLGLGAGLGSVAAVICYHLFSHVQVRVQAFLDPWSYIDSMGYQITQSLFAISGGGLFGLGLTKGTPDKIPYVETDFIFAAVTEEMGLIFSISLIFLCLACFFNILWVSLNFGDRFFRFTAFGFAVIYAFQTFLIIGGNTKFIPLTGVTLPFVSYGGSSMLSTIIMFSIVESIYLMQQEQMRKFRRRFAMEKRRRENLDDEDYDEPQESGRFDRDDSSEQEYGYSRTDSGQRYDERDYPEGELSYADRQSYSDSYGNRSSGPGVSEDFYFDDDISDETLIMSGSDRIDPENSREYSGTDPSGAYDYWSPATDDIDLSDYEEVKY